MFVISFNICLFIYFSVKYAIQSNDCDVFANKQSIYLSIYLGKEWVSQPLVNRAAAGNVLLSGAIFLQKIRVRVFQKLPRQ